MTTKKVLLILDEKLVDEFDKHVKEKGSTRTEQIRAAMQFYLKWEDKMIHPMVKGAHDDNRMAECSTEFPR